MEWITQLNPVAQTFAVIGIFAAICIGLWQFLRDN